MPENLQQFFRFRSRDLSMSDREHNRERDREVKRIASIHVL